MPLESSDVQERETVVARDQPGEVAGSPGRRNGRSPRTQCWGTNARGGTVQVFRNVLDTLDEPEKTISVA